MSELLIFKASAGSGKTYSLVKEYLKIVLKNPAAYKSILAITFTNKAANELKERIIQGVINLASNKDNEQLSGQLKKELPDVNLQFQATKVLQAILHDYSNFRVVTIDSFLFGIIKSFTRELSLPYNLTLEMNTNMVIDYIIDDTLQNVAENEDLEKWLKRFILSRIGENKGWRLTESIQQLAKQLFNEKFQKLPDDSIFLREDARDEIVTLSEELEEIIENFERKVLRLINDCITIAQNYGLKTTDFKYGNQRGLLKKCYTVKNYSNFNEIEKIITIYDKHEEGSELLYNKTDIKRHTVEECYQNGLSEILAELKQYWQSNVTEYNTAKEIKKIIYSLGILSDLGKSLKKFREEHDKLMSSDVNKLLIDVTQSTSSDFLFEKTGNQYKYFLIDEFQDTSDFQWASIRPLIDNSLSSGSSSILVGDVKQSIYRWRGGDLKLLLKIIYDQFSHYQELIRDHTLDQNFRSREKIIEFNNYFFSLAPKILAEEYPLYDLSMVSEAYETSMQKPTGKKYGYVKVEQVSIEKNDNTPVFTKLVKEINRFIDLGFQYRDIAILVRFNYEASQIARFFSLPDNVIPFTSSDALVFTNSFTVNFIIKLLKLIEDENDDLLKADLLYDYHQYIMEDNVALRDLFEIRSKEKNYFESHFNPKFINRLESLKKLPLYELIEELTGIFNLHKFSDSYLLEFSGMALEFTESNNGSVAQFLEFWEETGNQQSISEIEGNTVRIETVHKAKGLQFPVVLIPFPTWEINISNKNKDDILWVSSSDEPFSRFPFLPVRISANLLKTNYLNEFHEEVQSLTLDNLNLLYVAFTRAIDNLVIFLPNPIDYTSHKFVKMSQLIEKVILNPNDENPGIVNKDRVSFVIGEPKKNEGKTEKEKNALTLQNYPINRWREKLIIKDRSFGLNLDDRPPELKERIEKGVIIHGLLEKIEIQDDMEKALNEAFLQGEISEKQKNDYREELEDIFSLPELRNWFSGKFKIMNEKEIVLPDGTILRPDRVMLGEYETIVIDYKTGKPHKSHEYQIRKYGNTLKQMGYPAVELYLFYISSKTLQNVDLKS